MICPTTFSLTDSALDFLHNHTSNLAFTNINVGARIALNNIFCYTCNQTIIKPWIKSIVEDEINCSFSQFNYLHLRLLPKHNPVKSKYCSITSEVFQKFALVTHLNTSPLTINFYNVHENYEYFDNGQRILYPLDSTMIYSMEMLPLTFYLIDQSVPHNYESNDPSQVKIFTASNKGSPIWYRVRESNPSSHLERVVT